jgi:hypothetical protein
MRNSKQVSFKDETETGMLRDLRGSLLPSTWRHDRQPNDTLLNDIWYKSIMTVCRITFRQCHDIQQNNIQYK